MKAIQELKNEHAGIELLLRIMQEMNQKIQSDQQVNAEDLNGLMEFITTFIDKCHHGKEEDFLFPALEAVGISRKPGPIGIMLQEHQQGRLLATKLKEIIRDYIAGKDDAKNDFKLICDEYVSLLNQHIAKENNVLFPIAVENLNEDKDLELVKAFEELEKERIGQGKHEEFHALLERLQKAYLA